MQLTDCVQLSLFGEAEKPSQILNQFFIIGSLFFGNEIKYQIKDLKTNQIYYTNCLNIARKNEDWTQ